MSFERNQLRAIPVPPHLACLWPGDWNLRYREPQLILSTFPRADVPKLLPQMWEAGLLQGVSIAAPHNPPQPLEPGQKSGTRGPGP